MLGWKTYVVSVTVTVGISTPAQQSVTAPTAPPTSDRWFGLEHVAPPLLKTPGFGRLRRPVPLPHGRMLTASLTGNRPEQPSQSNQARLKATALDPWRSPRHALVERARRGSPARYSIAVHDAPFGGGF